MRTHARDSLPVLFEHDDRRHGRHARSGKREGAGHCRVTPQPPNARLIPRGIPKDGEIAPKAELARPGLRCASNLAFSVSAECAAREVGAFTIVIGDQLSASIAGTIISVIVAA
jgi:hypothetical protein